RNVWDGASRAMSRSNFSPEKKVDVKFTDDYGISEGAVDNGGPTQEFFRLSLQEIKAKIGIVEDPPNAKVLTCNSKAMKDNGYLYAGQIMAMSIAHGGQCHCFLSEILYECFQKGSDNVRVKPEHSTDEKTRSQVQSAETESQLQDAVAHAASLISLAGHNVRLGSLVYPPADPTGSSQAPGHDCYPNHIAPVPSRTFLRVVSLLEGRPTSPFRAEPWPGPVGKDPDQQALACVGPNPRLDIDLNSNSVVTNQFVFVPNRGISKLTTDLFELDGNKV
ncbi:hypothetical protein L3Q82_023019, partial [Scortum barcoo]